MKLPILGPLLTDPANRRAYYCNFHIVASFFCIAFLIGGPFFVNMQGIPSRWGSTGSLLNAKSIQCKSQCRPPGTEPLPLGIVSRKSNLEMTPPIQGSEQSSNTKDVAKASKNLLAIAVGIKQKKVVDRIAKKFFSCNFTIMLFHYDGVVDEWGDLQWSDSALHVSGINQTKWWFAKRFLHPDIVAEYNYIFLWDEDLGVEHFHPGRYISIIKKEGLEISQPALDMAKSEVHHQITARGRKGYVHRRIYKSRGGGRCYENSTAPPCTGWVEMMAPVFSRAAWRCVWHMIQNDLIHAWGLDKKLGYCAQGDRSKNIGVVDREYIVHLGIPTLGGFSENKSNAEATDHASQAAESYAGMALPQGPYGFTDRSAIRRRSYAELIMFQKRWKRAVAAADCWNDPYPETEKE
ncbi:uncharacterized protein LOC109725981 isoform X1 [Ananas comosus]|uniref:Uncharacterized protein LOC109725981 isoform X1 n=1 Tax=Ananas comosus TaxID=4615 RepID=A0A6P5GSU5_ANACO|nr:uncharacterized protein LOC109725981 isoform X1 [Ananas comosus]